MADYSAGTESQEVVVNVTKNTSETIQRSDSLVSVPFLQKVSPNLPFVPKPKKPLKCSNYNLQFIRYNGLLSLLEV